MDELLTIKELSLRIKIAEGTLRNYIWKKIFIKGKHYLKPARKVLFIWREVEIWLRDNSKPEQDCDTNNCRIKV